MPIQIRKEQKKTKTKCRGVFRERGKGGSFPPKIFRAIAPHGILAGGEGGEASIQQGKKMKDE